MKHQNQNQVEDYLSVVHAYTPREAYIGLTSIANREPTTYWFENTPDGHTKMCNVVASLTNSGKLNVYLRVTPVAEAIHEGRGTEEDSLGSSVLWAEIDNIEVDDALLFLNNSVRPPTMVVNSGTGVHCFWQLTEFSKDVPGIKARNKYLTSWLRRELASTLAKSDSIYDTARILRVPGTPNVKYDPPRSTGIVWYDPTKLYECACFPQEALSTSKRDDIVDISSPTSPLPDDFLEKLEPKLRKRIETEVGAKKSGAPTTGKDEIDHSKNDFYITLRLLTLNFGFETIKSVLMHPKWVSGYKFREKCATRSMDEGLKYVKMTIEAAWEMAENDPTRYFDGGFQAARLGAEIIENYNVLTVLDEIHLYTKGAFMKGDGPLERIIQNKLGLKWKSSYANDTLIWIRNQTSVLPDEVNIQPHLINLANGVLDLETGILIDHSPQYRFTWQLPVVYDPTASTDVVDAFVGGILEPDEVNTFWEYVGSSLIRNAYFPKKFLIIVGPPSSGKSKLLKLLEAVFGRQNCSALSLHDIATDKFSRSSLQGKLLNMYADLSEGEIPDAGMVKALTGEDTISADRKYMSRVEFIPYARLIFSANQMPAIRSADTAFYDRVVPITASQKFEPDPFIKEKVTTPHVLSGAFNRVLEGYKRVVTNKGLSETAPVINARKTYVLFNDTVAGFLDECTEKDVSSTSPYVPRATLYSEYRWWCKRVGRSPLGLHKFYARLREVTDLQEKQINLNGKNNRVFVGIRLIA